jgi:hypothetical protein
LVCALVACGDSDSGQGDGCPASASCDAGLGGSGGSSSDGAAASGGTGGSAGAGAGGAGGASGAGGLACEDGVDGDGDGVADYPGDAGCDSPHDDDESGDALLVISATTSASSLVSSINALAAGPVTVRSDGTTRTITGDFEPPRQNVALNDLDFSGSLDASVDGTRVVECSVVAPGIFENVIGADDVVLHDSLFDGDTDSSGFCVDTQIIFQDNARMRITGNTFQNYCDAQPGDHSEALYIGYDTFDMLIAGNTFTRNGSTGHIFFTWWSVPGAYPRRVCVTGNSFNETYSNVYDIQAYSCSGCADEIPESAPIFIEDSGAQAGVVSTFPLKNCQQCLDGIDNDGDGLLDLWDPQCTDGEDNAEDS